MENYKNIKADYSLFLDIQIAKYLKSVNKSEFSSKEEAENISEKIISAYNKKIAFEHLKLDNMNIAAKTAWFNSVEIDFNNIDKSLEEDDGISDEDIEKVAEMFYERFPFLPEGSIGLFIFIGPALNAYGLPIERFKNLLFGDSEITQIEEDLISWAFELTFNVFGSIFEKKKTTRQKLYKQAVLIGEEFLNRKDSIEVVEEIHTLINNVEKDFEAKTKH